MSARYPLDGDKTLSQNQRKRQRPKNEIKEIAASLQKQERLVNRDVPVSLGKPSLRKRLEAYYKLIAPEQIANEDQWRKRFDLIYQKYGGTLKGEAALSANLAKKYGTNVRLQLTTSHSETDETSRGKQVGKREEKWFQLRPEERGSNIVEFTSDRFDPFAALMLFPQDEVERINDACLVKQAPMLDFCDKFRPLLPPFDPMQQNRTVNRSKNSADENSKRKSNATNKIPVFSSLAANYENAGPLSLLYSIHSSNKRIRVMIRYVDCVRGVLTGYLLAFDKHFNMILRDVDEVYSKRITQIFDLGQNGYSKAELEMMRRTRCAFTDNHPNIPQNQQQNKKFHEDLSVPTRQRHFPQMLVRGDNVIMVWRADQEKSRLTTKESVKLPSKNCDGESRIGSNRIGTPGSLILPSHQRKRNK